jgi:nucleotide-binding universal stress UspA family protein
MSVWRKQQNILYALGINENQGKEILLCVKDVAEKFKIDVTEQLVLEIKGWEHIIN